MIDLHCHLDLYPNPEDVVLECEERGLYVLSVTTTPSAWSGTSALTKDNRRIRTALGLHPQLAKERASELSLFDQFVGEAEYIGEIGLDGSPECRMFWDIQVRVFEHILKSCATAGGRVMSIHSRRASKQVLKYLSDNPNSGTPVLHWFSGSFRDLDIAKDLDCWYSVGPAMLRGDKGKKLVAAMPVDRILTETDGPFTSIDGVTSMPWDVDRVNVFLAEIWGCSIMAVEERLKKNFIVLFRENGNWMI